MIGFVCALVAVVATTVLLDTRLARGALQQQARDTLKGELEVLRATVTQRQSALITGLRNASQTLAFRDVLDGGGRVNLVNELSPVQRNLGLDTIGVVQPDGRISVILGVRLADLAPGAVEELANASGHHLLPTVDGRYVDVGVVTIGDGARQRLLVGGHLFDDAAAFRLRSLSGSDVLLVADGELAGTTLSERPPAPPAFDGARTEPSVIDIGGAQTFVDYVPLVASGASFGSEGAIGVALPEPLAELDRTLGRSRLLGLALVLLVVALLVVYVERLLARPLLRLSATAQRVAAGDPDASFEATTDDEIGVLARTLENMRRATVEQVDVIRQQAQDLRTASERIVGAQDEERRRLANDLHDGLQRQLVLLRTRFGLYRQFQETDPDVAEGMLEELERETEAAIASLRDTAQRIFPSILQDRGLDGGLHSLAGRASVSVEVETDPDPLPRVDERVELNAYLLTSEALTNAMKHADPDEVRIRAGLHDGALVLEIADDGCGFDPADVDGDGGLRHLQDRVTAVGGHLDVSSSPGAGTLIRAVLPLGGGPARISPGTAGGRTAPQRPVGSGPKSR